MLHGSDKGTVVINKVPAHDIQSIRGRVPIHLRHELYDDSSAPVIRTLIKIYDQMERPLVLETFTNIEDKQQKAAFEALAGQKTVLMLFYDETLTHRLTKAVTQRPQEPVQEILRNAQLILAQIPKEEFNFDRAKAAVMKRTTV